MYERAWVELYLRARILRVAFRAVLKKDLHGIPGKAGEGKPLRAGSGPLVVMRPELAWKSLWTRRTTNWNEWGMPARTAGPSTSPDSL